ncbi:MAG: hypothetical protein U9Q98_11835 [Bacteroidota bacterium]|nr:hypothetical protein [Bacteroidota bacterium]
MKKLSIFTFAAIFSIFAISCNNGENKDKEDEKTPEEETKAQIVDLESFNEAYETLKFETCDEFETAVEHYADIYFTILDKAVEGNEDAIAEFKELHGMLEPLVEQAEKLEEQCAERIDELESKYEERVENNRDKIDQIIHPEDQSETEEKDESAEKELVEKEPVKTDDPEMVKKQNKKTIQAVEKSKIKIEE